MSTLRLNLDKQMKDWGFNDITDFLHSSFHSDSLLSMMVTSASFTALAELFRDVIGFPPMVYIAFVALLLLEVITGIKSSLKEGIKIESKRFGRFILKVFIYTIMLGTTHVLSTQIDSSLSSYIYSTIHNLIFHYITIQLIISIFENLSRMGFQESNSVYKAIHKHVSKYINLHDKK